MLTYECLEDKRDKLESIIKPNPIYSMVEDLNISKQDAQLILQGIYSKYDDQGNIHFKIMIHERETYELNNLFT